MTDDVASLRQTLNEVLEQQKATGEILRVISQSPTDTQPVFDMIAERAMRLCGALNGGVNIYDGGLVRVAAHVNLSRQFSDVLSRMYPMPPGPATASARAILIRATVHIPDIEEDPEYAITGAARMAGFRSALAVPMLRAGEAIGAIVVYGGEATPFSRRQIQLLETFADQAVIAIENVRLFTELGARNHDLDETLAQQTATSEILRVISSSPTDVQPVFEAIVGSAVRLCEAEFSAVARFDDGLLHLVALNNLSPEETEAFHRLFPRPLERGFVMGRAFIDGRAVHIEDVLADPEHDRETQGTLLRVSRFRSFLGVPILRDGVPVGVIGCARREVKPFSATQIELVKTFADQAVIAIENVRQFKELEARNRELTDTLDRQTATADILQVISQAQADVQPVFEVIADSVMRLLGPWSAAVFRHQSGLIRLAAARGGPPGSSEALMEQLHAPRVVTNDYPPGRAVLTRVVQHVVDVDTDPSWGSRLRDDARLRGFRSVVAVPMLRGGDVVGVIGVNRNRAGGFAPAEIALLETFADQAVIAIENARLLSELQGKNVDLTEALEQQTATAGILRVISSSPWSTR